MTPVEYPQTPEDWDFWPDGDHAPALNMALDEALLLTAARRARPLLRFYGWDRPAVSIGYTQHAAAAPAGFAMVRRPTGGGVVYHDVDFTYTVVIPANHWLNTVDRIASYAFINHAVLNGLARCRVSGTLATAEIPASVDRHRMVCFQTPTRYDVLAAGRKVAGSAQRRTRDGILHQGSLHFGGPLPCPKTELARALLDGFQDQAHAVPCTFTPPADLLQLAERLARERYATAAWNHRR